MAAIVAFFAFTFRVNPDELGVVVRFGKPTRQEPPGLHFRLPYPIEEVRLPKVTRQNIIEVGFRSGVTSRGFPGGVSDRPEESLMLTGDENIVDVDFVVFWRIRDAQQYLFNIQNPEVTVKEVAESAMREIVGQSNIQPILTEARQKTEQAVQKLMQDVLDTYQAGIRIEEVRLQKVDPPTQVIDAFRDVQAARADQRASAERGAGLRQPCAARGARRGRAHPAGRARLQGADGRRGDRSDVALPQGAGGIQEGARRHAPAHVSGNHGARAGRHRQDHHRRQGRPGRGALPAARSAAEAQGRGELMLRALAAAVVVTFGAIAAAAYFALFVVHVNEQAIVLEFGKPVRIISEPGLYWKIPVVQTVDTFDKRILDLDTAEQEVTAADQKRLKVDAFARYRIVDPLLFYQAVRDERSVRSRLSPVIESALRRVLGGATFTDLVRDKREALMKQIAKQVNEEGKEFGLEVVDVRIKRADLPDQNQKNVFDRMRAERQREAAEFRAEGAGAANRIRANADREVTIIKGEATREAEQTRGEGDAERNRIFADAFNRDPDFFGFYRSMQAYEAGHKAGRHAHAAVARQRVLQVFQQPQRRNCALASRNDERHPRCDRARTGARGPAVGIGAAFGPQTAGHGRADARADAAHGRRGGGRSRCCDRLAGAGLSEASSRSSVGFEFRCRPALPPEPISL